MTIRFCRLFVLVRWSTLLNVENVGSRFHSLRHPKREELASNIVHLNASFPTHADTLIDAVTWAGAGAEGRPSFRFQSFRHFTSALHEPLSQRVEGSVLQRHDRDRARNALELHVKNLEWQVFRQSGHFYRLH